MICSGEMNPRGETPFNGAPGGKSGGEPLIEPRGGGSSDVEFLGLEIVVGLV